MIALNCNIDQGTLHEIVRHSSNTSGIIVIVEGTGTVTAVHAETVAEAIWETISFSPIDMDDEDLYPVPIVRCWTTLPTQKVPHQTQRNLGLQQYQAGVHPQNRGRHFNRKVHWKRK